MTHKFMGPLLGAAFTAVALWPTATAADDKEMCFKGSGDVAIAACTRRIAVNSSSSDPNARHNLAVVYYSRGFLLLEKGENKRALADFDTSWRTDPSYARALYSRGITKKRLGDTASGEADIMRAKELQPSLPN